jgi:hypothetical protein
VRKRFKSKARSCGLCKPHKRGMANRWPAKQRSLLLLHERDMLLALRTRQL